MEVTPELIETIKEYINAYEEESHIIEEVILEAIAYIEATVGTGWKGKPNKERLAKLLLKKLCADIYDNRGTQTTQVFKQDRITSSIMTSLSIESGE